VKGFADATASTVAADRRSLSPHPDNSARSADRAGFAQGSYSRERIQFSLKIIDSRLRDGLDAGSCDDLVAHLVD